MSERRILKWTVPVDDQWHPIGGGPVVHVACQDGVDTVQVWTDETGHARAVAAARVFGTGQPLPDHAEPVGSVVTASGRLVWHLLRATEVTT